jgi:hypothetical protein
MVSISDAFALGCVGSEFAEPGGVIFDFLGGEEPPLSKPWKPPPWSRSEAAHAQLLKTMVVSKTWLS